SFMMTDIARESYQMMRLISYDISFMDIEDMLYFHIKEHEGEVLFAKNYNDEDIRRLKQIQRLFPETKAVPSHYLDADTSSYYVVPLERYKEVFLNDRSVYYVINKELGPLFEEVKLRKRHYVYGLERVHKYLKYFLLRVATLRAENIAIDGVIIERLAMVLRKAISTTSDGSRINTMQEIVISETDALLAGWDEEIFKG